jgi:flagellar biosynthesis regulator FlaF
MISRTNGEGVVDRIRIQEKALSNLADTLRKEDSALEEELRDIKAELKALKLFMSRNIPEFKKQFPEIQRKIK